VYRRPVTSVSGPMIKGAMAQLHDSEQSKRSTGQSQTRRMHGADRTITHTPLKVVKPP
jgi:hypothetical protein